MSGNEDLGKGQYPGKFWNKVYMYMFCSVHQQHLW